MIIQIAAIKAAVIMQQGYSSLDTENYSYSEKNNVIKQRGKQAIRFFFVPLWIILFTNKIFFYFQKFYHGVMCYITDSIYSKWYSEG